MYKSFFKRVFDFLLSLTGLIILLPIFLIVMLLLMIANHGKVFFIQRRPGKDTKIFSIIKFKTMNDKKAANGDLLPDAERMTKIGTLIRRSSLDEIPQLVNVLLGDMSLIGPRPLLPEYLPYFTAIELQRHQIRPGITGWAQVNGRNAISWEQKFEYDVHYVQNISFWMDTRILFLTLKKIFLSDGVSADGHVTMPSFITHRKNKLIEN